MKYVKTWGIAVAITLTTLAFQQKAYASECGLSCCIAAGVDGVGSDTGLTISLQYDTMIMGTNKQGSSDIANDTIISNELAGRSTTVCEHGATKTSREIS